MFRSTVCAALFAFVVGAALAVGQPAMAAAEKNLDSRISDVTVYQRGAWVTRQAQVTLVAGQQKLIFAGLSAAINQQQLQVGLADSNGQTPNGVQLGQVQLEEIQQRQAFDTQVNALQDKIDAINLQISSYEDAKQTAQLKLKFLDGIAQGYAKESWFEGARGNVDISSWRSALAVLDEGASQARADIRASDQAMRDAQQTLSQLKREMQTLRGKQRVSSTVSVALQVDTPQRVNLSLRYFQNNASWSPLYTAYLDSERPQLRLVQQAQVSQQTDEDWRGVNLTLSTSVPSGALVAPSVRSEFLDLRDPLERLNSFSGVAPRSAKMAVSEAQLGMDQALAPQPEVNRYSVTYRVPGQVTVGNDADNKSNFDLAQLEFTPTLFTRIVPRLSADTFLVAKFKYAETLPLYGSSLMVYVDQTYVGRTALPTLLPGSDVTLPVGQDRMVELVVENQGGRKDESGFIGRRKSELTANLFQITNRRSTETTVEVFDWYPTATNDDIEVEIPRTATPPTQTDVDDKPGVVVWRKNLQAGEDWKIRHEFEVSYPADKSLVANPG